VAGLLAGFLGGVEYTSKRRIEINLPGSRAAHLWTLGKRCLHIPERLTRVAARTIDQAGRETFRVVEQNFKQMFGGKLVMAFPQSQRLCGLHETASAVGKLFEIHFLTPSAHMAPVKSGPQSGGPVPALCGCILLQFEGSFGLLYVIINAVPGIAKVARNQ